MDACVCDDPDCTAKCKECCDTGRVDINPTLNVILTHPNSFPGCGASGPCICAAKRGKVVIR